MISASDDHSNKRNDDVNNNTKALISNALSFDQNHGNVSIKHNKQGLFHSFSYLYVMNILVNNENFIVSEKSTGIAFPLVFDTKYLDGIASKFVYFKIYG